MKVRETAWCKILYKRNLKGGPAQAFVVNASVFCVNFYCKRARFAKISAPTVVSESLVVSEKLRKMQIRY